MEALAPAVRFAAEIRNAAWMVRYHRRPSERARTARAQAIVALGLAVRRAFNESEDFEPLLVALVEGLRPAPEPEPF